MKLKEPGDKCGCCVKELTRLYLHQGALICAKCDDVAHWPKVKKL